MSRLASAFAFFALLIVTAAPTSAEMAGSWESTGGLGDARFSYGAVRLGDAADRWLVAGGSAFDANSNVYRVGSAEIYDPARGTWRAAGDLATPRAQLTLERLPDGRAIAIGGLASDGAALASCEIWDPGASVWIDGPALANPRRSHASVALADGRVFAFGGGTPSIEVLESDPSSPAGYRWRLLDASLDSPRSDHTATWLPAVGLVLVAGGRYRTPDFQTVVLDTAELFDPATESVRLLGARMSVAREMHGAIDLSDGRALIISGMDGSMARPETEFFELATETFSPGPSLMMGRANFGLCRMSNGKVMVCGGYNGQGMGSMNAAPETYRGCEKIDPLADGSWMMGPDMADPRLQFSCTAYGMRAVVAGGRVSGAGSEAALRRCEECRMDSPLAAPARVAPTDGGSTDGPVVLLDATDVAGAASYDFQVAEGSEIYEPLAFVANASSSEVDTSFLEYGRAYAWRVRAVDAAGKRGVWSGVGSFTVPADRAPVLDPIENRSVAEGETLRFTVTSSDPDRGDTVSLSSSALPRGASFSPSSGVFEWIPDYDQAGSYTVTFTARDLGGLSDGETITIAVANTNRAPELEPIGDRETEEGENLSFQIHGTDPDGDPVTYLMTQAPSGASLDSQTGWFSWTPDSSQSGVHSVTFHASDGESAGSETIRIRVRDVVRREESHASIAYNPSNRWPSRSNASASGGAYKESSRSGATATLSFAGSRVKWIGHKGPNLGIAEVRIDGELRATVDLYQASSQWRLRLFDSGSLPAGSHTIEIRVLARRSASSSDVKVPVDAFDVTE